MKRSPKYTKAPFVFKIQPDVVSRLLSTVSCAVNSGINRLIRYAENCASFQEDSRFLDL